MTEERDIVERLRGVRRHYGHTSWAGLIATSAIEEIERLRAFEATGKYDPAPYPQCTCVPSDTQDWPLTSGRCPVHAPTEASDTQEEI